MLLDPFLNAGRRPHALGYVVTWPQAIVAHCRRFSNVLCMANIRLATALLSQAYWASTRKPLNLRLSSVNF